MDHSFEVESYGNVKISADVISTIAATAAREVSGVVDLSLKGASDIKGIWNSKMGGTRGIKVDFVDESVAIVIYITVAYNAKIPDIAAKVQENVKAAVETMTGLVVGRVNVVVNNITNEKSKE